MEIPKLKYRGNKGGSTLNKYESYYYMIEVSHKSSSKFFSVYSEFENHSSQTTYSCSQLLKFDDCVVL